MLYHDSITSWIDEVKLRARSVDLWTLIKIVGQLYTFQTTLRFITTKAPSVFQRWLGLISLASQFVLYLSSSVSLLFLLRPFVTLFYTTQLSTPTPFSLKSFYLFSVTTSNARCTWFPVFFLCISVSPITFTFLYMFFFFFVPSLFNKLPIKKVLTTFYCVYNIFSI